MVQHQACCFPSLPWIYPPKRQRRSLKSIGKAQQSTGTRKEDDGLTPLSSQKPLSSLYLNTSGKDALVKANHQTTLISRTNMLWL